MSSRQQSRVNFTSFHNFAQIPIWPLQKLVMSTIDQTDATASWIFLLGPLPAVVLSYPKQLTGH